ncbi:CstA-like transporter-associated (seleno)protein [Arenibaculum pallidiluteum]|uniref:CstA-like transporter-associated (seleno)protein n=1 Tax=Arenibaculum pallidiluteum TaxID=2812559 RepID=UPI001A96C41E|nr:YbdD/YjiX family protein [Arenibaculum pallidiluteum]
MLSRLRAFWSGFRQVIGDDAYDRYLERHNRLHADAPALDRKTFFRSELERKWNGIRRCC